MKKHLLSLSWLLICFFILSTGCQALKDPKKENGLLTGDELEQYTSQFGFPLEQVKENLAFSDLTVTDDAIGIWQTSAKRVVSGLEFSLLLYENPYDGNLYRYSYGYSAPDESVLETGFSIASQAMEAYGSPSTYPGISSGIFNEEGKPKEPDPSEEFFCETWQISENVQFKLSIFLSEEQNIINLEYSNEGAEWQLKPRKK